MYLFHVLFNFNGVGVWPGASTGFGAPDSDCPIGAWLTYRGTLETWAVCPFMKGSTLLRAAWTTSVFAVLINWSSTQLTSISPTLVIGF